MSQLRHKVSVQCTVQSALWRGKCEVYTVNCKLYSLQCAGESVQYTLFCAYRALCSVQHQVYFIKSLKHYADMKKGQIGFGVSFAGKVVGVAEKVGSNTTNFLSFCNF